MNGSGIPNVFKTNKDLSTMQKHWMVQIRQWILAVSLLETTAKFITDHPVFLLASGLIGQKKNWTCGAIIPLCPAK